MVLRSREDCGGVASGSVFEPYGGKRHAARGESATTDLPESLKPMFDADVDGMINWFDGHVVLKQLLGLIIGFSDPASLPVRGAIDFTSPMHT
jgi:hypothetical protein